MRHAIQHDEILAYGFFGLLTTGVDLAVFFAATRLFACGVYAAEALAWLLSVLFAYAVNRRFVFASHSTAILRECARFVASRIFGCLAGMGALYMLLACLRQSEGASKLLSAAFVMVLNFITGKRLVFRAEKMPERS